MITFLWSALEKIIDISVFETSLAKWSLIPSEHIFPIAIGISCLQLAAALMWLSRTGAAAAVWIAVVLLVLFSAFAAYQAAISTVPKCDCISILDQYFQQQDQLRYALARNAVMVFMLVVGTVLTHGQMRMPYRARAVSGAERAFTVLEMMLVIALVGVLVSLLAPSLGRARDLGRRSVDLANMRSHAAVFHAYSIDWRDNFPFFMDPRATSTVLRPSQGQPVAIPYFFAHAFWNYALADGYYEGSHWHKSFYTPTRRPMRGTSYYYGCAFLASPSYWNQRTRTGLTQLVPTSHHQVRTPSIKALFTFIDFQPSAAPTGALVMPDLQAEVLLGMVDGNVRGVAYGAILPGVPTGDGTAPGERHLGDTPPSMHTMDGVEGRDAP